MGCSLFQRGTESGFFWCKIIKRGPYPENIVVVFWILHNNYRELHVLIFVILRILNCYKILTFHCRVGTSLKKFSCFSVITKKLAMFDIFLSLRSEEQTKFSKKLTSSWDWTCDHGHENASIIFSENLQRNYRKMTIKQI